MSRSPTRLNSNGELEKQCGKCREWWPATPEYFRSRILKRTGWRVIHSPCLACQREYTKSPPQNPSKWTADKVAQLHEEYEAGATLHSLAVKSGCQFQYISVLFHKYGLRTRDNHEAGKLFGGRKPRFTEADVQQWYRDYQSGMSIVMVAKKYGVSDTSISRRFRKHCFAVRSYADAAILLFKRLKDDRRSHPWKDYDDR